MNFKNNKGYTGVDISVAMIIILVLIPTVFGIIFSIQRTGAEVNRKAEAVRIITDILETAKSLEYSEISLSEGKQFVLELNNMYTNLTQNGTNDIECLKTGDKNVQYKIKIEVNNYFPEGTEQSEMENVENDLVKKIKVTVTYPIGNITKSIDISTLIKSM